MTRSIAVVGSGPNGLAAATRLSRAGFRVDVFEANDRPGGGLGSAESVLPGFVHDHCASVFPFARTSPFFRTVSEEALGFRLCDSEVLLAHPLDDGSAVLLHRSIARTAAGLGGDGPAYRRLMAPLVAGWDRLAPFLLGPLVRIPRHPWAAARFGAFGTLSTELFSRLLFHEEPARALFAGLCAHQTIPLHHPFTAAYGLVLMMAGHVGGWPFVEGGSQRLAAALAGEVERHGGRVLCGTAVDDVSDLRDYDRIILDCAPREVSRIAGDHLAPSYRLRLEAFRHGPGVVKLDYVLDGAIPWLAEECARAGTVHLGGTLAEIAAAKREVEAAGVPRQPFVIVGQCSVADPTRSPDGRGTVWAYAQMPRTAGPEAVAAIEAQIERYAPGFSSRVAARRVSYPADLEAYDRNLVGGDIAGGALDGLQMFLRPVPGLLPYLTPNRRVVLCSASTPPGGGVHGMGGYWAADVVMRGGAMLGPV